MRLTNKEQNIIQQTILNIFGKSNIYLFGSRVDDNKKGGDIDLLIVPKNRENITYKKHPSKSKLEYSLQKPIDLIIFNKGESLIENEGLKGVLLNKT